jgi:hypothetical protein
MLFWVPSIVRGDDINKFFDTSHYNRYIANQLGIAPDGSQQRNGLDFWWDGQGAGNCWQAASEDSSDPVLAPRCGSSWGSTRIPAIDQDAEAAALRRVRPAGADGAAWLRLVRRSGLWRISADPARPGAPVRTGRMLLLWRQVRGPAVLIASLAADRAG